MLRVGYHSCEEAGAGRWGGREDKGTGALSVTWDQTPSFRRPTGRVRIAEQWFEDP